MLVEFLTALACSAERNIVRGYPEPGPAFDVLSQVGRNVTGDVKHPIAFCADKMVMVKGLVIKMGGSVQPFAHKAVRPSGGCSFPSAFLKSVLFVWNISFTVP